MSFPRYPAYKPSGVEWLGEVPEHWEEKPLKRITSRHDPTDQAIQEPEAPFSIRRRQRGGRRVVAVSSSVSAMDALRARIRAQSKTVADHIAADPEAQGFIDDWATAEPISR